MRRRDFLKLVAASGAGAVVFTGCDLSTIGNGSPKREFEIQSPVNNPQDFAWGRDLWYATAYSGVSGGSGLIVRVYEGRAKKVDGNPDYPLNMGRSTALEQSLVQELYHPDRIGGPLVLKGDKGSGNYQAINWDDALNEFNSTITAAKGSVLLITPPVSGSVANVIGQTVKALGGDHVTYEPEEGVVLRAAMNRVFGSPRFPTFDLANTKFLLNFGAEFLNNWISPVHMSIGYGEFRQGNPDQRGRFWHVGPQLSATAASADKWVPIKPGTEGLVALSMAQVISSQGLAKGADVGSIYQGITLDDYSPDKVAPKAGITADQITELATMFAQQTPSLAIAGTSAAGHTNGLFNLTAVYSLNYLVGSVGAKGGVMLNPGSPLPDVLPEMTAGASYQDWQGITNKIGSGGYKLVLVYNANPVYGLPPALGLQKALGQGVQVVSFSNFMDETTVQADLVLPTNVTLEDWGLHVPDPGPGYPIVGLQQPVVDPFVDSRSFVDLLIGASKTAGTTLPWANNEAAVRDMVASLQKAGGGNVDATDPNEYFATVQGQGGWWNTSAAGGNAPTAPKTATNAAEPKFAGDTGDNTFFLLPYPSNSLGYGQFSNLPWLQALPEPISTGVWSTWVELNPTTGKDLGVNTGDVVKLTSPAGNMELPVYINPAAAPDVALVPFGQGHELFSRYAENRGENIVNLIAPQVDSETGALATSATRVKIEKANKKVRMPRFEGSVPAYQLEEFPIIEVQNLT
jgi:anaerobic selenocysteine-containing dehydrogenase